MVRVLTLEIVVPAQLGDERAHAGRRILSAHGEGGVEGGEPTQLDLHEAALPRGEVGEGQVAPCLGDYRLALRERVFVGH